MDLSIARSAQDGVTNGAIYALLALALVLVFTVTRVIWIPSGEFVTYGTLTLAGLQLGKPPGTIGLLIGMAVVAAARSRRSRRCATANGGVCRGGSRSGSAFRSLIAGAIVLGWRRARCRSRCRCC